MQALTLIETLLAITVFVALAVLLYHLYKGIKNKNYEDAKKWAMIYLITNGLRLAFEYYFK